MFSVRRSQTASSQAPGRPDYSGLSALFINTTLKPSSQHSHTSALMDVPAQVMQSAGVAVSHIRAADHDIAPGVQPDMHEAGFPGDAWPELWPKVKAADILVIGTPIWLGMKSSICQRVIERLYAQSGQLNDKGQSVYYGRTGGVIVTGNEDGAKACAREVLYALSHLGYTVPPQADAAWLGEVGPGPSYGDEGSDGPGLEFTQKNAVFMAWNLMHVSWMLKQAGGLPSYGNDRRAWEEGARFDHPEPERIRA
jgi:multimeric flavodoxin WrbA